MAADDPTELVWEKKWVGRPAGTQHGRSRDDDGTSSSNLFVPGSKGVKAQAKIRDIDEDEAALLAGSEPVFIYVTDERASDTQVRERSELEEALGTLMVLGVLVAVLKAKPHVKRWWSDQALPALKSTWNRLPRTRKANSQIVAESPALIDGVPEDTGQEVIAALEAYRASMSSAEARDRFVAALMARIFSEEQLSILRNARIEDDDGPLELESAAETLTAQQIGESITLMLEANPSLLDEGTLTELGKILGGSRVDGEYVPVRSEQIKEALRLTDGEA